MESKKILWMCVKWTHAFLFSPTRTCGRTTERACSAKCVLVCVHRPAVLGSLSTFLILCILNQDHTSHLSDDERSFGHFCQQAQLQSWKNKDSSKSPFWLCSSSIALPSLCYLSLVFCLISLSDVPCLPFFNLWARHWSLFLFLSVSHYLSLFLSSLWGD